MKQYLLVVLIFLGMLDSCTGPEPKDTIVMETVVLNDSNHQLEYILYGYSQLHYIDTITILNGEKYIEINNDYRLPEGADSVKIRFDNEKQITYYHYTEDKRDRNVFLLDAYIVEKINEEYFKFTYIFTDDDYNNATEIE